MARSVHLNLVAMKLKLLVSYPKATGTIVALLTLIAGALALEAADFGAPRWLFVPILAWLITVGLPTTVTVLLLASLWGTTAPLHGFIFFCLVASLLAIVSQVFSTKALAHFAGGRHEN